MKLARANGSTSNILRFVILDSTSATGGKKTGLTSASSGLIISTIAHNEATPTTYTVAGSTIETITTLGTFAAPTSTKCRFKEVDATNHPGLYEIHIADARFAVSNARSMIVTISGATGMVSVDIEIDQYLNAATLGAAAVQAVWDAATSALTTAGSIGKRLVDLFAGITVLAQWLGILGGKQTGNTTARAELRATGAGSGTYDETTDSLQAIRDNMTSSLGAGASSNRLIIQSITLVPIADADVWVTTDSAGTNVVAGTRQTNSSGEVTFYLDSGTVYYRWAQKDNVNFDNPKQFTAE